eukprot:364647-Chlamydomonas_euryale.AAC.29
MPAARPGCGPACGLPDLTVALHAFCPTRLWPCMQADHLHAWSVPGIRTTIGPSHVCTSLVLTRVAWTLVGCACQALLNLIKNTNADSFDLYYGLFLYNQNATEELERLEKVCTRAVWMGRERHGRLQPGWTPSRWCIECNTCTTKCVGGGRDRSGQSAAAHPTTAMFDVVFARPYVLARALQCSMRFARLAEVTNTSKPRTFVPRSFCRQGFEAVKKSLFSKLHDIARAEMFPDGMEPPGTCPRHASTPACTVWTSDRMFTQQLFCRPWLQLFRQLL